MSNIDIQDNVAADYWNQWQDKYNYEKPQYTDWGDHPTVLNLLYEHHFGSPTKTIFDYIKEVYPEFSSQHVLSLCSGDGTFEKLLLQTNVFGSISGIDIAKNRVETANNEVGKFSEHLNFIHGDVNNGEYGKNIYDVVFAKASLHHIENLEAMFAGVKKCLKPGGKLVTLDFFWSNSISMV